MGIRSTVGSVLESVVGRERTNRIRLAERKARNGLAKRLAMEEPKSQPRRNRRRRSRPESPRRRPQHVSLGRRLSPLDGSLPIRSCRTLSRG